MPKLLQLIIICISTILIVASATILIVYKKPEKSQQLTNIGGDFVLHDINGNVFDSKNHHDKYWLLYFGFTHCPDICPTALYNMVGLLEKLGKDADKFLPIFITIDPQRDSKEHLSSYLKHFGNNFVGLTGSDKEIKQVADLFKVYYAIDNSSDSKNYNINHTSLIYLIDKKGNYITHFSSNELPETMYTRIISNKKIQL